MFFTDLRIKRGLILKNLRNSTGKSQAEVAKLLGTSQQVYQNYEAGRREANYDMLIKLANLYNVSIDYLLGREQNEPDEIEKKMTVKEMEDDIVNRWLNLGEIGREIVYNMLLSMVDLAEAKKQEETLQLLNQNQITQQSSEPPIQQQPVQPTVVQSNLQRQIQQPLQQPNLQRQMPVQQPVSTEPPPQSKIQIDPKKPWRLTARRIDGVYESRLATPEELEKLRLILEDSENGPEPEY